jgi:hypothetical protein
MQAMKAGYDSLNDTSGVLKSILVDSPHAETVRRIEDLLGIDRDFPAVLNLVERVLALLLSIPAKSTMVNDWVEALESVQEAGKRHQNKLVWTRVDATSRAGNPLGGKFKKYPLPAFLLQEPKSSLEKQALLIQRLFLEILIQQQSAKGIHSLAVDLRQLIANSNPRSRMAKLPVEVSGDWSEWIVFIDTFPDTDDDPLKRLRNLLERLESAGSSTPGQPAAVIAQPDVVVRRSSPGVAIKDAIPSYRLLVTEPGDCQTAEPPKAVALHVSPAEIDQDELASEQEIDAEARETRHWISRYQRLTPNTYTRLTEIERSWLASRLCEYMNSEDAGLRLAAGLVALIYVTGMPLENLLETSVGPADVFDVGGEYRRRIRLPSNAYTPDEEVAELFLPQEPVLKLQLPRAVSVWMAACIQRRGCTLAEALNIDEASAREHVKNVLDRVRAGGPYTRIRYERIPAALAIELTLKYRDLALVHYLASGPEQVSPMITYYVVHSLEELQRCYREVVEDMLSAI